MGRKGRNALAPTTLNMFPKFELAAILMYLTILPKTRRPSKTPCSSTSRLFFSRMISEDSLAMSTALSTEMPTSAAFRAGASLMHLSFDFHPRAETQHFLDSALADKRVQPGFIFHDHRHAA